jgi:hypothetical protein
MAISYHRLNMRYGTIALMGLIVASIAGLPIFTYLLRLAEVLMNFIIIV